MLKEKLYELIHKQPFGTDELVDIHQIIIPDAFKTKESRPSKKKMIECRQKYHKLGFLDKPIEVQAITNEKGKSPILYLTDKYTRLCVAFEYGLEQVPVKYIEV